jgi:hypothetical protein
VNRADRQGLLFSIARAEKSVRRPSRRALMLMPSVLLADDSALMRKMVRPILHDEPRIVVLGEAEELRALHDEWAVTGSVVERKDDIAMFDRIRRGSQAPRSPNNNGPAWKSSPMVHPIALGGFSSIGSSTSTTPF